MPAAHIRRSGTAAVALAAGLVVAGCGGGTKATVATSAGGSASTASTVSPGSTATTVSPQGAADQGADLDLHRGGYDTVRMPRARPLRLGYEGIDPRLMNSCTVVSVDIVERRPVGVPSPPPGAARPRAGIVGPWA